MDKLTIPLLLLLLLQPLLSSAAGPVIDANFPDPCLAQSRSGQWFAFATQSGDVNIQVASSRDFTTWTLHEGYDALPTLPPWTLPHPHAAVWAPDVNPLPNGHGWIMYFAALGSTHPLKHCIGTATSPNITGPYTPDPQPLICSLRGGGNIDPNLFVDPVNGNSYLVYKVDGNAIGHGGSCGNTVAPVAATPLYLQQLSNTDLKTKIGAPVYLASNLNPAGSFKYDGPNTERPSIAFRNNTYYLLYNVDCYAELTYRIAYVSCVVGVDTQSGIAGCNWVALKAAQQRRVDRTLLKTNERISGAVLNAPGSMDTSADSHKMVFHGDTNLNWFQPNHAVNDQIVRRKRAMYAAQIEYEHANGNLVVTTLF
jgi:Glycosyl hydrolases family 43